MKKKLLFIEVSIFQNEIRRVSFIRLSPDGKIAFGRIYNDVKRESASRLTTVVKKQKIPLFNSFVGLVYKIDK